MDRPRNAVKVAPSLLSADFGQLAAALETISTSSADRVHLDVMDGNFVEEITFGTKLIKDLREHSDLLFDVHLMVRDPKRHVARFAQAGANMITVHLEACQGTSDLPVLIKSIKELGIKAGVAISPPTVISDLEPVLDSIDIALIMTVNPGAGGQKLIPSCLGKAQSLSTAREQSGQNFLISVDGGLHRKNVLEAAAKGADIVVIGSAIWNSISPRDEIRAICAALTT